MVKASVGGYKIDNQRQTLLRDIFGSSIEKNMLDLHSAKELINGLVVIVIDQLAVVKKQDTIRQKSQMNRQSSASGKQSKAMDEHTAHQVKQFSLSHIPIA